MCADLKSFETLNTKCNVIFQLTGTLDRTVSAHRKLEEEMRDSNEKKDAVAHWEAQIAEIIQWYVLTILGFREQYQIL